MEAWQLVCGIAALGCGVWLARALSARLALKKLQTLATHRLALEQCWLLIAQVPEALLSTHTRKALGKILSHHLAHSHRSGTDESAQELRIARLVGHTPQAAAEPRPTEALAQALRQLIDVLDRGLNDRVLSVSLHIRAHDRLQAHLIQVEDALNRRKARIDELLYLPFGPNASART